MPENHLNAHGNNYKRQDNLQNGDVKRPSIRLNVLSNWITLGVSIAVGFFLIPAILAHLGEKRFGIWILVSSFVGYFGLLRLGVGTGVLRYVSLFRGKGKRESVAAVISTAMLFYIGIGFLILILSFLFADSIADFFGGGRELSVLIQIFGLAAAIECPSLIFDAAIRGYEGFVFVNLVTLLGVVTRAAILLSCIVMGYGLVPMGWAVVIVTCLILAAKAVTFKRYCKDVKLALDKITVSVLKLLVLYGLIIMVESCAVLLTFESPKLIVAKVVSLEKVGLFGIVALLIRYYRSLIYAASTVLMPRFSYLSGKNADDKIRQLFLHGSRYIAIIAGAVAALIWTIGPSFMLLWIKNENIQQAVPALVILAAGSLVLFSHRLSIDLLLGLGKQKELAIFAVIEGALVVALSITLSFQYGITGVALGASVPLIVVRGIIQTRYLCRMIKVSFWQYYAGYILRPMGVAVSLGLVSYLLGIHNLVNSWSVLFGAAGIIALVYGVIVFVTALENNDRHYIKALVLASLCKLAGARGRS